MKIFRLILYAVILASLFFAPLKPMKIANLEPIQAVRIHLDGGIVVLETDTGDKGSGATAEEALGNMKENSTGIIYLDTAQYLFVSASAREQIPSLQAYLKESVRICQWSGQGDISEAVKYAEARKMGLKSREWTEGSNLPELPPIKQDKYGKIPS